MVDKRRSIGFATHAERPSLQTPLDPPCAPALGSSLEGYRDATGAARIVADVARCFDGESVYRTNGYVEISMQGYARE
jgi:hypothetical protein